MAKIKAAEATRKVLNWLVARCLGCLQSDDPINVQTFLRQNKRGAHNFTGDGDQLLDVIESRQIGFLPAGPHRGDQVKAFIYQPSQHDLSLDDGMTHVQYGPSISVACLRTYVCSVLGDDAVVEVPDELLEE